MVALEWAATYPHSARAAVALAAPAAHPAWAVAWNHVQRATLDLAGLGREAEGLALARQIAMLSYRAAAEFDARFGRAASDGAVGHDAFLVERAQVGAVLAEALADVAAEVPA